MNSVEISGTVTSFPGGPVGEGDFTIPEDRQKLAGVLKEVITNKLQSCLLARDFPAYRRHLNLQPFYFRGLPVEPVSNLVQYPLCQAESEDSLDFLVAKFLHQNGLHSVRNADKAGWAPLHYAALGGDTQLIAGLLRERADPNQRTAKDEPKLGIPPLTSALSIALLYGHNDAGCLLLDRGARSKSWPFPAMHLGCC